MRVLHVYKDYPPVIGGIENHLRVLAEHQARRGLDVTVLVTAPGRRTSDSLESGVRVIRAARLGELWSTPLSTALLGWLRRLAPDVAHLQFPYPLGDVGQLLLGRARALVVTYQSDIVRQRLTGLAYRPLQRWLLETAQRVIATSPNYPRSSPALARVSHKCRVVPMGIETAAWGRADPAEIEALRRRFPGPLVLFVGRLRYYKGLEYLIRALETLDASLVVVGQGRLRARLERQALLGRACERTFFLGDVPQELLPSYYAAADVLVLPSSHRSEAYGLVLLEAMACGTPVISTELQTGTSFVNVAGETGLVVPPRDPAALARALRECLADPLARRRMGETGRRRVQAEFRAELMVDRVLQVYDEALHAAGVRVAWPAAARARSAPPPAPTSELPPPELRALEQALTLAVLYADVFDYALHEDELRALLVGQRAGAGSFTHALARLSGTLVARRDGYVTWLGREHLVERRRARAALAPPRWRQARRFAALLRWVPFVRLVAVCGSQARDNADERGDIDLFCVSSPGRLWLVQAVLMLLRRLAPRGPAEICPNYLLALDSLAVEAHDLYRAHEVVQAVPLWGQETHSTFLQANAWVAAFLPGCDPAARREWLDPRPAPAPTLALEKLLSGRLGEALDRTVHRLLLRYYGLRLRGRGVDQETLRAAYRRDRQTVVGGGYASAVAQAFLRNVRTRLPPSAPLEAELRRLFPLEAGDSAAADTAPTLYRRLFAENYGQDRRDAAAGAP